MRGDRPTPYKCSAKEVYPACAGIDLTTCSSSIAVMRLPRMRGDRPQVSISKIRSGSFTPHARGSTTSSFWSTKPYRVYPACAGIDLIVSTHWMLEISLPRMRGDRPYHIGSDDYICEFTPHARGSTRVVRLHEQFHFVYPACAGIDPHSLPS